MRVEGLIVDCRMYRASGIGVYVQNILRRLGQFIPEERITLLGGTAVVDELAACMPHATVRTVNSRIYTLREQWELLLNGTRGRWAWWSPHFNIPVCHRGPLVVTVHDLFHLTRPEVRQDLVKLAYARLMFTAVRRCADKIICVSRFTANEFERLVGARAGQLEVIHNGVDESWYGPVSGARKEGTPYFLFVGNLKPHKNIQGLIRAFAGIVERIPHDLVIVGQRSGFITFDTGAEALAQEVGPRVKFTGFAELGELRQWYKHATALVFPSFYEGFGLPPLEAMAARCPVIASNAGSIPEICGGAALYCDPHDTGSIASAMLALTENSALREQLMVAGELQAKKYRWADAAARTGAILQSVM